MYQARYIWLHFSRFVPAIALHRHSLRKLYAGLSPSVSFLYGLVSDNTDQWPCKGLAIPTRRKAMNVLDGVALLLAAGLFVYLTVALLRADRH